MESAFSRSGISFIVSLYSVSPRLVNRLFIEEHGLDFDLEALKDCGREEGGLGMQNPLRFWSRLLVIQLCLLACRERSVHGRDQYIHTRLARDLRTVHGAQGFPKISKWRELMVSIREAGS